MKNPVAFIAEQFKSDRATHLATSLGFTALAAVGSGLEVDLYNYSHSFGVEVGIYAVPQLVAITAIASYAWHNFWHPPEDRTPDTVPPS